MIIKFFKKEKKFKKEEENLWLNINFYWKLAVCFMFIVFLLSFIFGYRLFMRINKESNLSIKDDTGKIETVKKEKIEKF